MSEIVLKDLINFRGDRLFHGAVNLSWFWDDSEKNLLAAQSYVFHGPDYHGVQQSDIGISTEHHLQDTATFLKNIINSCYHGKDNPLTLAIAGYGTGKSHLALTIANLLSDPDSELAKTIVSNVEIADTNIGKEIGLKFLENNKPCLVVALNGMKNFDLTSEVSRQIYKQINSKNIDTTPLDELRPRFMNVIKSLNVLNDSLKEEIKKDCNVSDFEKIIESLKEQDEHVYKLAHDFLLKLGFPIKSMGGESIDDIISTVVNEYCGQNKPFQSLVFLFDEFGRYTEYATTHSQITGSGVLQSLYEGIQDNSEKVYFIGFIQFELNAYLQRIAPEYKNEISRFITRYQSSDKVYLSVNLETLIANLIQKKDRNIIDSIFENESSLEKSQNSLKIINKWFAQSRNYNLWKNTEQFHKIISKGCWPLSPFSTWFLYHLTASGKHLQERSALTLLNETFLRFSNQKIIDPCNWNLYPTDLWSKDLEQEFISSEDLGQSGSVAHSYITVLDRYKERLSEASIKLLQAIVLSLKMGAQIENQQEALMVFKKLCGLEEAKIEQELDSLKTEFNVIEWDETIKFYDILGDSASRIQFLSFLTQKVANIYNEEAKAKLFMGKAATWFDLLKDLECDFAEENLITTKEWNFQGRTSDLEMLPNTIAIAAESWEKVVSVDNPRGTIIYCYINQHYNLKDIISKVKKQLMEISFEKNVSAIPIIVVLLYDEKGELGQYLAEYSVLIEHTNKEDLQRFGNLIKVHKEKLYTIIQSLLEKMLKDRHYITPLVNELESTRLNGVASELFKNIYPDVLPFFFDGFSTARGNAAKTCFQLTSDLLLGKLDYNRVLAMPVQDRNRSLTVLKESWEIFNKNGLISRYPGEPIAQKIIEDWEEKINSNTECFNIGDEIINKIKPPYGTNIASIGLLFGIFVAARFDSLIFRKLGHQFAILQLINDGDIFKGRFLDVDSLKNIELVKVGDESVSEWQGLLDKWERCESYRNKIKYYTKSIELKSRIPIPGNYIYRYDHLYKQSLEAEEEIRKKEETFNTGLTRIEAAIEIGNFGKVSRGAAELLDLQEKMQVEATAWTTYEINELTPHIERAKQLVIQYFSNWLSRQVPRGEDPDQLAYFKHYLLDLIGGNLKKLGLDSLYEEVAIKAKDVTRLAEESAKANQLDRDIKSFLQIDEESLYKIPRIAKIRGLQKTAQEYMSKSKEILSDIAVAILSGSLASLHQFVKKLKETEKLILEKAMALWDSEIHSIQEVEEIQKRINDLSSIFEGCEADLEDLNSMNKAIKSFKQFYKKIDEDLTWEQFETISKDMTRVIIESFHEDETLWQIDQILVSLYEEIKNKRINQSEKWLNSIEKEFSKLSLMSISEASQLHSKLSNPPTYLTKQNLEEINKIINKIEEYLSKLEIDWLIVKFKELPESSKKEFLKIAQQIVIV